MYYAFDGRNHLEADVGSNSRNNKHGLPSKLEIDNYGTIVDIRFSPPTFDYRITVHRFRAKGELQASVGSVTTHQPVVW